MPADRRAPGRRRPAAEILERRRLPSTITVTSTLDTDGAGAGAVGGDTLSLRQAIELADGTLSLAALGPARAHLVVGGPSIPNTIDFAIPGAGPQTIRLTSALPTIGRPTVIDGYSQPGAHPNTAGPGLADDATVRVALDGTLAGPGASGLVLLGGDSTVQGLAIGGFHAGPDEPPGGLDGAAIRLGSADAPGPGGDQIRGNFLGLDAAGLHPLANAVGIALGLGSGASTIGGTATGDRNLISGNLGAGIGVDEAFVTFQQNPTPPPLPAILVEGNSIGTDPSGTRAMGNGTGILLADAGRVTVGGTAEGAGNLVSGNLGDGVATTQSPFSSESPDNIDPSGNLILGNRIGTDAGGSKAVPNGGQGVALASRGDTVGGLAAGSGNLISGNAGRGVFVDVSPGLPIGLGTGPTPSADNLILGNRIGTDATGTRPVANGAGGILDRGDSDTIGGTAAGAGNLVSGNSGDGIDLSGLVSPQGDLGPGGSHALVQGNRVGTSADGTAALANLGRGILVVGESATIGGTAAGAGNLVSGNLGDGLAIADQVSGNRGSILYVGGTGALVLGNRIGTDTTGTRAVPNVGYGVSTDGNLDTIGGTAAGAGNVISGNVGGGLMTDNSPGLLVQGNRIGTDPGGTLPVPNSGDGLFDSGDSATIGGTAAGAGNVISANRGNGLVIQAHLLYPIGLFVGGSHVLVQGNRIGTDPSGVIPLGNARDGVLITGGGSDATIGGTAAGAANAIAFNGRAGVGISDSPYSPPSLGNRVSGNAISADGGLGIDLGDDGVPLVTPPGGSTLGPNRLQPAPVLRAVGLGREFIPTLLGTLDAAPSAAYTLEFFVDTRPDPSGFGEGERPLGSIVATTDPAGHASFSFTSTSAMYGESLTATATGPAGDTSEFARDLFISPPTPLPIPPVAATTTTLAVPGLLAVAGQPVTLTATVAAAPGVPTGLVAFAEVGVLLGFAPLDPSGHATLTTTLLGPGVHGILAGYLGDEFDAPSVSAPEVVGVLPAVASGGPTVTSAVVTGPRSVVIAFSRPLRPGPAQDPANYAVVGPDGRADAVASAAYDPSTDTVTLRLRSPLNPKPGRAARLTVDGRRSGRVVDLNGVPLGGGHLGRPGTTYVGTLATAPATPHPSGPSRLRTRGR